uniref:T9SS type A sorting domain-containing protein n=1 Tax=uncultured Draconibacterium sp. TaxID=1573823 RepID=UPI0032174506
MKKQLLFILILGINSFFVHAQKKEYNRGIKVPHPVCYASGKVEKSRIPPPRDFLLKSGTNATSNIEVTYIGFSEEAKSAFAYAVSIWESLIESDMPIRMKAVWNGGLDENVLGNCGPESYYTDFKDIPVEGRYYPVAIAEKISKQELNGESRYDMVANFNKNFEWYLGTDMECPDTKYDFVSVVLHEIAHGLGFTGFFYVEDNLGVYAYSQYGDATSFDELVLNVGTGKKLLDTSFYENVSLKLKNALESNSLVAKSPVAWKANNESYPLLYAPDEYDGGSSVYHLNDRTYPYGNENSLMTHAVGRAEAIHNPGPVTMGIMADIGWRNIFIRFDPPKDMEELNPVQFDVSFESDYEIDTNSVFVIYSTDGFSEHIDSLKLVASGEDGLYQAFVTPQSGTDSISYFIAAADVMGGIKTSPTSAPDKYYSVKFGPDSENPVIVHTPVSYFLLTGEPMSVTVQADDNVGIDTVYVGYSVNNVEQTPFGLMKGDGNNYSGIFTADIEALNDGDTIEYTIFARDLSDAKNTARLPAANERFSFAVEAIFEPVSSYSNDFNEVNADFVLSDFDIYTGFGFRNGALHSTHPYPSPGVDNEVINLTTILKYPVILKADGTVRFDEVVLVEPGEPLAEYGDDDFWDYVIVEGSKDYGRSWKEIINGYDSGADAIWKDAYDEGTIGQNSKARGSSDMYIEREINLLENGNFAVGDTILIRFRLYSDPYASGWGWAIDNLVIQQPMVAGIKTLARKNLKVYPNPFKTSVKLDMNITEKAADIQIDVYNILGRKVHSVLISNAFGELKKDIDLTHLRNGMFLLKVSENGKTILSKKLIKN